ncbi:uncharacterized protein LOC105425321 [Pogonomyrmex barbatus]|uniref:Uncharacterized protein LOC105425321 n=1 Tax=Pogonomyrmex barbatus TaxID=144034 RepID=A0A6I9W6T0_9HYME|nr:uncharacterized protein LOC105425321 [Pogonomyrmex barbatus]
MSIESSVASSGATETMKDIVIPQQKRPPPPLPPPLPSAPLPEKCQRNKSRSTRIQPPQCDIATRCSITKNEHQRESRIIDIATRIMATKFDDDITLMRDHHSTMSANDDPVSKSSTSKSSFRSSHKVASKQKGDKYPSLFFTLKDFENVVSDAWDRDYSAITPDPENSQNLHEKESSKVHILDDDDGDVCFRVTTTNLPFEKCLGGWKDPFEHGVSVRNFDDHQFEDDNSNENDEKNDENLFECDIFDNNDDSKCRVDTKVRFMIESPSSSGSKIRDSDVKIGVPRDSLRSCESILNDEQSAASSVKLTEIRDEFVNVKGCRDKTRDKSYSSSVEKGNSTTGEDDPFVLADANKVDTKLKAISQTHCDDRNNDVNRERIREGDFDLISPSVQASDEILETGKENTITTITRKAIPNERYDAKQVDQSNTSPEVAKNIRRFTDKSSETACKVEKTAKITQSTHREKEIFLKKTSGDIKEKSIAKNEKILIDESAKNFLNKHDDKSSKSTITDNLTNKLIKNSEKTQRLHEENTETSNSFVDSKNNREKTSPSEDVFAKNIPVKIRRNSFLETMLSDDSTDISMNCAITPVTSTNTDKELSASKSPNKIQELNTNIAIESERTRDFHDTKIDIKDQTVLKSSKEVIRGRESIVKVSNIDIKSTQPENKSASDVKNDVLNELLCNFNNIKLKIVSPENKKPVAEIDDDKNITRSVTINNKISKKRETASKSFEKSQNEICSIPANVKITNVDNNTIIIDKITKEENFTKMKIKETPQNLKEDTRDPKTITKNKNIETKKPNELPCDIENKITKDDSKMKIDKNSSSIKSEEIRVNTKIEKTFESIESAIEVNREPKKSRNVLKTILKKKNVDCERQQANEFQKRIPIGAPATMNKIFDSREFNMITDVSCRNSLENRKKRETASMEIHTRGEEKTDKVIANDEADDDRRRIANRSALALVEDTMGSGDKCAIARKITSVNPCNNDNNRAVTPVANVSTDQSFRDVVTITPGKVKSFVKYYEIRGDATTVERHSKINDREKVVRHKFTKSQAVPVAARNSQRPEVITEGKEMKDEENMKSNDDNFPKMSFNKTQPSTFAPRVSKNSPDDPIKTTEMGLKVTKRYEKNDSHTSDVEVCAMLAKTGAKKSVQFLGGFTVIHSETFGENESIRTVVDPDVNMVKKRRAPEAPPPRDSSSYQKLVRKIAKSEEPPDRKDSLRGQEEAVAQIHAGADHVQDSGINRFSLKPETPQLVFYCTI